MDRVKVKVLVIIAGDDVTVWVEPVEDVDVAIINTNTQETKLVNTHEGFESLLRRAGLFKWPFQW